jgi:hypothetical protein
LKFILCTRLLLSCHAENNFTSNLCYLFRSFCRTSAVVSALRLLSLDCTVSILSTWNTLMAYVVYKMSLLLCFLTRFFSFLTSIYCKKGLILYSLDLLTDYLSAYTCRKERKNPFRNYKRKPGLVIIQKCFERFRFCPPSTHDKTQTLRGGYLITQEDCSCVYNDTSSRRISYKPSRRHQLQRHVIHDMQLAVYD